MGKRETHSNWGGRREGAGRKPAGDTPKTIKSFSLAAEAIVALERKTPKGMSASQWIERLILDA